MSKMAERRGRSEESDDDIRWADSVRSEPPTTSTPKQSTGRRVQYAASVANFDQDTGTHYSSPLEDHEGEGRDWRRRQVRKNRELAALGYTIEYPSEDEFEPGENLLKARERALEEAAGIIDESWKKLNPIRPAAIRRERQEYREVYGRNPATWPLFSTEPPMRQYDEAYLEEEDFLSNTRQEELQHVLTRFGHRNGFREVYFIEDLLKLDDHVIAVKYNNPKIAIIGHAKNFGTKQAADRRTLSTVRSERIMGLLNDASRMGTMAGGVPAEVAMLINHPDLYPKLAAQRVLAQHQNLRIITEGTMKLARHSMLKYQVIFTALASVRFNYLEYTRNLPLPEGQDLQQIKDFMACFPIPDDNCLREWMVDAEEEVFGSPADDGASEHTHVSFPVAVNNDGGVPQAIIQPPDTPVVRNAVTPSCFTVVHMLENNLKLDEPCTESFCVSNMPHPEASLHEVWHGRTANESYDWYPLRLAKVDARGRQGPFDVRLSGGRRNVIFMYEDADWANIEDKLTKDEFFLAVTNKAIISIKLAGWNLSAYRKAGFKRAVPPTDAFAVMSIAVLNGLTLFISVRYGGEGEAIRGARVPLRLANMLAIARVRCYQFQCPNIAAALAAVGVTLASACNATNRALLAFPQPDLPSANMKSGATFVAEQLGLPILFEAVRPQDRKHRSRPGAPRRPPSEVPSFEFDNDKYMVNVTKLDYSTPIANWSPLQTLFLFYETMLPLIFLVTEATSMMDNLRCEDEADVLRYCHFLVEQVNNQATITAGPNKREAELHPFGKDEFVLKKGRPGPAFYAVKARPLGLVTEVQLRQQLKPTKRFYPVDLKAITPRLKSDLAQLIAYGDYDDVTLESLINLHHQLGAAHGHRCTRCGSPSHVYTPATPSGASSPCSTTPVRCIWPPCMSEDHVFAVCPKFLQQCLRCFGLGHNAHDHFKFPFVRLQEDFNALAPFHARGISLIKDVKFGFAYDGHRNLVLTADTTELPGYENGESHLSCFSSD